jgi:hypothetical protein
MRWLKIFLTAGALLLLASLSACYQKNQHSPVSFSLWLARPVIKSMNEYSHCLQVVRAAPGVHKHPPFLPAELEIRDAANTRRIAVIPSCGNIISPYPPDGFNVSDFSCEVSRLCPSLPPGEYRAAVNVSGTRASNVARFVIDPNFDATKNPPVRLAVIEPPPLSANFQLVIHLTGPTPADDDFYLYKAYFGRFIVDGREYYPLIVAFNGGGQIGAGTQCSWRPNLPHYIVVPSALANPVTHKIISTICPNEIGGWIVRQILPLFRFNPNKPHEYIFKFKHFASAPFRFNPQEHHLGHDWDAATPHLQPLPPSPPSLRGKVTVNGQPLRGRIVEVSSSPGVVWQQLTDADGDYCFRNLPVDNYLLRLNNSDDKLSRYLKPNLGVSNNAILQHDVDLPPRVIDSPAKLPTLTVARFPACLLAPSGTTTSAKSTTAPPPAPTLTVTTPCPASATPSLN